MKKIMVLFFILILIPLNSFSEGEDSMEDITFVVKAIRDPSGSVKDYAVGTFLKKANGKKELRPVLDVYDGFKEIEGYADLLTSEGLIGLVNSEALNEVMGELDPSLAEAIQTAQQLKALTSPVGSEDVAEIDSDGKIRRANFRVDKDNVDLAELGIEGISSSTLSRGSIVVGDKTSFEEDDSYLKRLNIREMGDDTLAIDAGNADGDLVLTNLNGDIRIVTRENDEIPDETTFVLEGDLDLETSSPSIKLPIRDGEFSFSSDEGVSYSIDGRFSGPELELEGGKEETTYDYLRERLKISSDKGSLRIQGEELSYALGEGSSFEMIGDTKKLSEEVRKSLQEDRKAGNSQGNGNYLKVKEFAEVSGKVDLEQDILDSQGSQKIEVSSSGNDRFALLLVEDKNPSFQIQRDSFGTTLQELIRERTGSEGETQKDAGYFYQILQDRPEDYYQEVMAEARIGNSVAWGLVSYARHMALMQGKVNMNSDPYTTEVTLGAGTDVGIGGNDNELIANTDSSGTFEAVRLVNSNTLVTGRLNQAILKSGNSPDVISVTNGGDGTTLIKKMDPIDVSSLSKQSYKLEKGDTIWGISHKYSITQEELYTMNPSVGEERIPLSEFDVKKLPIDLEINVPATKEYSVVKGDTLFEIANDNGITLSQLYRLNPNLSPDKGFDPRKLQIGTGVVVFDKGSGSSPIRELLGAEQKDGDSDEEIAGTTDSIRVGGTLVSQREMEEAIREFDEESVTQYLRRQSMDDLSGGTGELSSDKNHKLIICPQGENSLMGDLNGDGNIRSGDAQILHKVVIGLLDLSPNSNICCADFDRDGILSEADSNFLFKEMLLGRKDYGACKDYKLGEEKKIETDKTSDKLEEIEICVAEDPFMGDLNGNRLVDIRDFNILKKIISKEINLESVSSICCADFDQNGKVDSFDLEFLGTALDENKASRLGTCNNLRFDYESPIGDFYLVGSQIDLFVRDSDYFFRIKKSKGHYLEIALFLDETPPAQILLGLTSYKRIRTFNSFLEAEKKLINLESSFTKQSDIFYYMKAGDKKVITEFFFNDGLYKVKMYGYGGDFYLLKKDLEGDFKPLGGSGDLSEVMNLIEKDLAKPIINLD